MFVTFYSYKGGVGRTLALGNIACLLAEDSEHPQRVLLWDFDLEAPGLHRLFPPRRPQSYGFVDLAHEYARSGELRDVSDYIYASEIRGVDVLPAGVVGGDYCARLEELNWPGFFGESPEDRGPFFGPVVDAIRALDYDYVLIDSRTGLGDQAGICTQLLPDFLVVLWRLNEQNLDGLSHVMPAIKEALRARGKAEVGILPVASCVAPSASPRLNDLKQQASEAFGTSHFGFIRFDPDFVTDERLFSLEANHARMWPPPFVLEDYRELCGTIRRANARDTRTALGVLAKLQRKGDEASAKTAAIALLRRRPRLERLWRSFGRLFGRNPSGDKRARVLVEEVLSRDPKNPFALRVKAFFSIGPQPEGPRLGDAVVDLRAALDEAPDALRHDVYRVLAEVHSARGDLAAALDALEENLAIAPRNSQVRLEMAQLHIRMGFEYFTEAIEDLRHIPDDVSELKAIWLALLHASLGQLEKAEEAHRHWDDDGLGPPPVFEAHYHIAVGNRDEALSLARRQVENALGGELLNWAEVLLCAGESQEAADVLDQRRGPEELDFELSAFKAVVEYIGGTGTAEQADVIASWTRAHSSWSFAELLFFRERVRRADDKGLLARLDIVEQLIRRAALHDLQSPKTRGIQTTLHMSWPPSFGASWRPPL